MNVNRRRPASHEKLLSELKATVLSPGSPETAPHLFIVQAWRLVELMAETRTRMGAAFSTTQLLEDLMHPDRLFDQYCQDLLDQSEPDYWRDDISLMIAMGHEAPGISLEPEYSPYTRALISYVAPRSKSDATLKQLITVMGYDQHYRARLTASIRWALEAPHHQHKGVIHADRKHPPLD